MNDNKSTSNGIILCSFMTSGKDHDVIQMAVGRLALPECVIISCISHTINPPDKELRFNELLDSDKANAISRALANRTGIRVAAFSDAISHIMKDDEMVYVRTPWHKKLL